jgi:hypothetical protein
VIGFRGTFCRRMRLLAHSPSLFGRWTPSAPTTAASIRSNFLNGSLFWSDLHRRGGDAGAVVDSGTECGRRFFVRIPGRSQVLALTSISLHSMPLISSPRCPSNTRRRSASAARPGRASRPAQRARSSSSVRTRSEGCSRKRLIILAAGCASMSDRSTATVNSLEITVCTRFTPTVRPLATSMSSNSWTCACVTSRRGRAPQAGTRYRFIFPTSSCPWRRSRRAWQDQRS